MGTTSLAALQEEGNSEVQVAHPATAPGSRLALVFLMVLLILHGVMNLWWLHADNHTIRTDEEGHMLLARTYYDTMFVRAFPDLVTRIVAVSEIQPGIPAHPPLLHVMGALMIAVCGYSTDTIALTNTLCFVLLLLGSFVLVRRFLDPWQSLFVVLVVSLTPMVFTASRFFMTDYASAAIVIWALVALVRSDGFHRPAWVFLFGVLTGLGILIRTVSFAYLLGPAILAVFIGVLRLVRRDHGAPPGSYHGGVWLVHMVMALTVCVGIFAPWYYKNLEPFYDYWSNKQIGQSRGALTNFLPPVVPKAPEHVVGTAAGIGNIPPASVAVSAPVVTETKTLDYAVAKVRHPSVAWIRYPVYLVNNGLFLPLACFAALGMVFSGVRRQFRNTTLLYLYAWIFGSWVFFSVLLRLATPRYGVPVAPALAIFAALLVVMLPLRWFRQTVGVLLVAVLLFQYGNLTIQPYQDGARLTVAAPILERESRHFIDDGLVVFKDHVTLSDSYGRLGAPRQDNYKERLIEVMIAHEKTLPVREGKYANYQKLRLRGMPLHEQHYWPGENPYRLASLSPEEIPERRLRVIHMGLEPEHLLARLPETDYIVYQVEEKDGALADAYVAYFGARGFEPVTSFEVPAFGWVPKTINGVLARKLAGEVVAVTAESIAAMNFYDLHELRESGDYARLAPPLQEGIGHYMDEKLATIASPFPMSEAITFMAADLQKTGVGQYQFRLVFRVEASMDRDWQVKFHGLVAASDRGQLPAEAQAQGYVDWSFGPQPPTSRWEAGTYVVLKHPIQVLPLRYQFTFGFHRDESSFGQMALLKPMDFGAVSGAEAGGAREQGLP